MGVEIARGHYLTNTNLDDLRRHDSIALQAALLDKNDDVDVVYQDFYYSLNPHLTLEKIAACGLLLAACFGGYPETLGPSWINRCWSGTSSKV